MNTPIRNIFTVAKREFTSYFTSPVAYVFLVIFLLLAGFFTFMVGQDFFARNEASLGSFFLWHPWLYLFLVPAVAMRLWAEEKRTGTLELLLTLPITPTQAVIGKTATKNTANQVEQDGNQQQVHRRPVEARIDHLVARQGNAREVIQVELRPAKNMPERVKKRADQDHHGRTCFLIAEFFSQAGHPSAFSWSTGSPRCVSNQL